jgi:hypothetical protein
MSISLRTVFSGNIKTRQVLGRTALLLTFDMTRTAEKTEKIRGEGTQTVRCLAKIEWTHRQKGDLKKLKKQGGHTNTESKVI